MLFTITSFNKSLDMYEVISDMGEKRVVSSIQITVVMTNGYEFTNAYLTRKGFAIKANNGTRYIQLNNISKDLDKAIASRLKYIKDMEEAKKQQMTAAIKKPITRAKATLKNGNVSSKIEGNPNRNTRIVYKGNVYLSPEQLCRQFKRDVNTFKTLYNKGYSLDECLGFMPLRSESEIIPRSKAEKMLDKMESSREV